jgi:DNA-directed RNA polymerase sigma subunit (sigma70/sigma32)
LTKDKFAKRNQEIFKLWFDKRMTFTAIGQRYNLSRERIRQIVRQVEAENV